MQRISIFFILLFSIFTIALSGQTIWYVSPTGSGSQNGSSWANAARLQVAINNAPTNAELRLRRGVYNITTTLLVQRTIRMYGGYTGSGDTRDPASTPSVLDGGGRVPIMETRYSTENSIFDGLTIQNGYARVGTHINDISVPGIFLQGSNSRIINCIFRNNISQNRIGSGAILLFNSDNVVIDGCRFEENRVNVIPNNFGAANEGAGAIQIRFVRGTRIINSTFRNNYSTYYGGAITHHGENSLIENCDFQGNTSLLNGGAIYSQYEDLRVVNSRFNDNRSNGQGGAIATTFSQIEIVSSIFRNNTASDIGGAIYNHRFAEPSVIEKSEFYENQSSQGGAVYNFSEAGLKIANTLFHRNTATDKGGAIFNYRVIQIANSTFVGNTNTAVIIPSYGTTQYNPYSSSIFNSIFYQNTGKSGGFRPDINSEEIARDDSDKDIRRNIVQTYNLGTANLIGVNPLFINNSANFRVQQTSPAVNYGVNALYNQVSTTPAGTSTDLAGLPRLVGASIDLGVYEVQPVVLACPAMTLPTPNATNVPITTNISWNAIANASGYRISIGTTPGGTNIRNNFDVGNLTTYNHPTNLSPGTRYYVRITPYNAVSATANCSEYSFTTASPIVTIPTCSTITFPTNNATNVSINPTISWIASSGATGYRIRVGTTAGGNDVLSQNLGNVTSFTLPTNLNYSTNYFVQIIPFNSAGDATGCVEHRFVTESATVIIPTCSTIMFPANNGMNVSINPTISWTASSGATGYRIRVGTTAGGDDVFSQNLGNVTSFTLPSNLNYNTNYFVQITPFNSAGDTTGCSEHRFTTENAPISIPTCSTITFPTNNATNVSINPTISWTSSSGATGYRIRVGTTAGGNDVFSQNLGNVTSFTLPSNLNYNTTYFVQIIPFNSAGDATGCSEHRFRTENAPITIPTCSTITFPTNNATNVSISPTISWTASSGATGYRIRVGTTAGGNDVLGQNLGNVTSFTLPTNLNYSTNYFVQIISFNSAGDATGCLEHLFTTENAPISIPICSTITFPTNNATNVSVSPTITWVASSGATGYRIRVGTTAGGNDVFSQNLGNVTSFTLPMSLNYNTNYFVQIIPFSSAGDATGCSEHRFVTESTPVTIPTCSTITFPTNNATSVSINPTISWTASSGATGYRIRVGTTAGGNDVFSQNLGNVTSFTLPSNLNDSTNYFVQIIPFNSAGGATGCVEHRFRTENTPVTIPSCSTITFPTNNATNVFVNPTISWMASSGATGYRIRVGTTAGGNDVFSQNLGNVTSFTLPSNLNYNTTYFVQIIPFSSAGDATGCSEHRFRTENAPISIPPCSTITFPANSGMNVSVSPTITWTASSGATGYRIRVGTTAGGSDFFSQNLGNVTSFTLPSNLNYNTTYFVQIIPFNSAGDATGCSEHLFTTENQVIKEFKIPNTFTPNGDGINDTIDFSELLNQNDLKIRVFDRYGKVHFEGNQSNQFIWDGTFYGKKSGTGTYWYLIEWTDALGEKHLEKGWILLKSR